VLAGIVLSTACDVDDHSRLACIEVLQTLKASCAIDFLRCGVNWFAQALSIAHVVRTKREGLGPAEVRALGMLELNVEVLHPHPRFTRLPVTRFGQGAPLSRTRSLRWEAASSAGPLKPQPTARSPERPRERMVVRA
jgi:hypothetical protein